jgi:hypothetical protein
MAGASKCAYGSPRPAVTPHLCAPQILWMAYLLRNSYNWRMPYQFKREPLIRDEATRLASACQSHPEKLVI